MYEGIQGAIVLSIISIVIVFIILSLLALLMIGLRKLMVFTSKETVKEEKGIRKEEKAVSESIKRISAKETQNEEIVSVISAAIASYLQSTTSVKPLTIISIKRIIPKTLNGWTISGRQNIVAERTSVSSRKNRRIL